MGVRRGGGGVSLVSEYSEGSVRMNEGWIDREGELLRRSRSGFWGGGWGEEEALPEFFTTQKHLEYL